MSVQEGSLPQLSFLIIEHVIKQAYTKYQTSLNIYAFLAHDLGDYMGLTLFKFAIFDYVECRVPICAI